MGGVVSGGPKGARGMDPHACGASASVARCPSDDPPQSESVVDRRLLGSDAAYNAAIAAVREVAEGVPDWLITVGVNAAQPHLTPTADDFYRFLCERNGVEPVPDRDDDGYWADAQALASFASLASRVEVGEQ